MLLGPQQACWIVTNALLVHNGYTAVVLRRTTRSGFGNRIDENIAAAARSHQSLFKHRIRKMIHNTTLVIFTCVSRMLSSRCAYADDTELSFSIVLLAARLQWFSDINPNTATFNSASSKSCSFCKRLPQSVHKKCATVTNAI